MSKLSFNVQVVTSAISVVAFALMLASGVARVVAGSPGLAVLDFVLSLVWLVLLFGGWSGNREILRRLAALESSRDFAFTKLDGLVDTEERLARDLALPAACKDSLGDPLAAGGRVKIGAHVFDVREVRYNKASLAFGTDAAGWYTQDQLKRMRAVSEPNRVAPAA